MKLKNYLMAIFCLFSLSGVAFGDRQLERSEILEILQKLTSQPRKTWIAAGTIKARHEEYRAPEITSSAEISARVSKAIQEYQSSQEKTELTEEIQKMKLDAIPFNVRYRSSNEFTMNSTVVVKFDGDRFSWEISVDSRSDSIKPSADLDGNFMTNEFKQDWNRRRRYTWDGQKYTIYSVSGNQAIVDTTGSMPHPVNGPLTAGLIPWGYGLYTYKNLSVAGASATELSVDGQTQVHMTLTNSDGSEMLFVLDPGRNYAVISHSVEGPETIVSGQYGNFRLVSGVQVPTTILTERYDASTNRLLASNYWDITSISTATPSLANFSVDYEPDALIQYRSNVTDKPALYRYSYTVDTDELLAERLDYAASEVLQPQNCATAALKYTASQLGRNLSERQLARLIDGPANATSLYAMKDLAQSSGLYCKAVKTDIQTLKNLSGCQVILHFPKKNHFVVLEGIDDAYAWSIDLSKDKFYYRTDLNFFDMDWAEGTALVISDRPIRLQGAASEIADGLLGGFVGGSGYSCTKLLQSYYVVYCDNPVVGFCDGYYQVYFTRYGCEVSQSGSCTSEMMARMAEDFCIVDGYNLFSCTVEGSWEFHYMWACK